MLYGSLKAFVTALEGEGELIRVKNRVSPLLCMAEVTDRLSKLPGGGKAVLFENTGTDFPVLMNAFGSDRRLQLALGGESLPALSERIASWFKMVTEPRPTWGAKLKVLPLLADASRWLPVSQQRRGACQEVVMRKPDLGRLPILQCWPHDGGPFITLPLVHSYHPVSRVRNVGMYRMQLFDSTTTGMHWHRHKTGAHHYEAWREAKKRMPVAVALGGDPVYTYAATAPLPEGIDEYLLAGFLRGKPVSMVSCITQDIQVPADADFVIEGYVDPEEPLRREGPFGDHTGFYSLDDLYPKFHVTCITHRRDAVYPATLVGVPPQEDLYFAKATEKIFLEPIKFTLLPEISDLHMPMAGTAHNLALASIEKRYPGQAIKAAHALWGAGQMMFNKFMVITDAGDCLTDGAALLRKALVTLDFQRDLIFSKGPLDVLDHSSDTFSFGPKLAIDLTTKLPEELASEPAHHTLSSLAKAASLLPVAGLPQGASGGSANPPEFYPFSALCSRYFQEGLPLLAVKMNALSSAAAADAVRGLLLQEPWQSIRLVLRVEEGLNPEDTDLLVWQVVSNVDPERDLFLLEVEPGRVALFADATAKSRILGQTRRDWPNVVASNHETIAWVDDFWQSGGVPFPFIESPSVKIGNLVKTAGARIENL
ncbi:MAG: menaquinone biosynthesis decarboxylase [Bacteroidales bacterium]